MSQYAWEVIDTAVKIGLGALISSLFTLLILKRNQKHEFEKDQHNRKMETLQDVTKSLSSAITPMILYASLLQNLKEQAKAGNVVPDYLTDELKKGYESLKQHSSELMLSVAKLRLLGLENPAKELEIFAERLMVSTRNSANAATTERTSSKGIQQQLESVMRALSEEYTSKK